MGVNSLSKTVTRQRRDCDLNPGPTAPESSTLTTRLPSHPRYSVKCIKCIRTLTVILVLFRKCCLAFRGTNQTWAVMKRYRECANTDGYATDHTDCIVSHCSCFTSRLKGKVFPYSLPSVGPGADPGVQAVSPQVT